MTAIIGGSLKGRKLKVPDSVTRPTSSRVREAMFSSVEHATGGLTDLRVLDLFAGSGALGIESVSRGATEVVLVEKDKRAASITKSNVTDLKLGGVTVVCDDVLRETAMTSRHGQFDVVFADPPYAFTNAHVTDMLNGLAANGWLVDDALIVIERSSRDEMTWPEAFTDISHKTYGDTAIWYGHYIESANEENVDA